MIKNIEINKFRLFEDVSFNLGKYLTVISGRNATGKSTLLGMIGNSAELKKKDATPLIQNQFRTEFREIFNASPDYDPSGSGKYKVNFCNQNFEEIIDYRNFRVTWQNNRTRFRIIPYRKKEDGNRTDGKAEWPILYLGLSRLFPIGESNNEDMTENSLLLDDNEKEWFLEKYQGIMSVYEDVEEVSSIKIGETNRKKGIGITTDNYDFLTNSSGQDNLGQILCALLSFKKLKENNNYEYDGGMLLIDEIDSTLHPSAQNKLIDLLIKQCKKFDIQIVFTTHSISLLKHLSVKTRFNKSGENNNVEIIYFTNANGDLEMLTNPSFSTIENELSISSIIQAKKKIKVYSEDAENRWFFRKIIEKHLYRLNILDISIGCNELLSLRQNDIKYFSDVIIILDGDVKDNKINNLLDSTPDHLKNILKLPGNQRPEEVIYNYILSLSADHPFWDIENGITKLYFRENGPASYDGNEREQYKKWFNDHQRQFDSFNLFDYWESDNQDKCEEFIKDFKEIFNNIAHRLFLPKIT